MYKSRLFLMMGVSAGLLWGSACGDSQLSVQNTDAIARQDGDTPNTPNTPNTPGDTLGSTQLALTSPVEGAIIPGHIVMVEGQTDAPSVTINGAVVEVAGGAFSHKIERLPEGPLLIDVAAGDSRVQRQALVDRSDPVIVLRSPARGSFFVQGQQDALLVQGQVQDLSGVSSLTVNGQEVAVDASGQFSTSLRPVIGTNTITVEASDMANHDAKTIQSAVYGQFNPWGQAAPNALGIRVSDQGLDLIGEALSDGISDAIQNGTDQGPGGQLPQTPEFSLRSIDLAGIELDLVPQDGWLDLRVQIYGLELEFDAQFNGNNISGEIESDPAEIFMNVHITADGLGGVDLALSNPDIELHDFDFDVGGLLGLVDWIFKGFIEDQIEEALLEALANIQIDDALGPDSLTQEIELLGQTGQLKLLMTQFGVDPAGLTVGLNAGLDLPPGPGGLSAPGTFATPGPAPMDNPGDASSLRISLADDFINQLVAVLWRADGLNLDLGELLKGILEAPDSTLPFRLNAKALASLMNASELLTFAQEDTPVGLKLRPLLPPIISLQEGDKLLHIEMGEVLFDFTLETPGQSQLWATLSMHLIIDLGLSTDENGEIKLDLAVEAAADLIDEPLFDLKDTSAENAIANLLTSLPALLGGDALSGLGGDAMGEEIQAFAPGLSLGGLAMGQGGAQGDFLNLLIDLTIALTPPEAPELQILHTEVNPDNGHTYHLLSVSNWSDAEAFAQTLGGHLVTIRDRDENRWIIRTFGRWDGFNRDMWIGLHDVGHEGEFVWVSGEPLEFERWASRSPDNGRDDDDSSYNEDFGMIYGDRSDRQDERWNDYKNQPFAPWTEGIHGLVEVLPGNEIQPEPPEGEDPEGEVPEGEVPEGEDPEGEDPEGEEGN